MARVGAAIMRSPANFPDRARASSDATDPGHSGTRVRVKSLPKGFADSDVLHESLLGFQISSATLPKDKSTLHQGSSSWPRVYATGELKNDYP